VARYQGWEVTFSKEQALDLLQSQAGVELPAAGEWLQLGIHDRISGQLLGDLALHSINDEERSFEIGFTLASESQKKGLALESVRTLLKFLFEVVGAIRVSANCDSRNTPAIRLLLALGFKPNPERSWSETFKNEFVVVDSYVLGRQEYPQEGLGFPRLD
jgi:aminoglycoside 6'-N-acetyltransferase